MSRALAARPVSATAVDTRTSARHARGLRRTGWSGVGFVILAMATSSLISLPLSTDPVEQITSLYARHRTAYLVAQVFGLLGVGLLVPFLLGLRSRARTGGSAIWWTGLGVAVAAFGTNVAVGVLCLAPHLGAVGTHRAALATDVTDDVLFAAFGLLGLAVAASSRHRALRLAALVTGLLCLGQAFSWALPGLQVLAPLAIMALLLGLAIGLIRTPGAEAAPRSSVGPSRRRGDAH